MTLVLLSSSQMSGVATLAIALTIGARASANCSGRCIAKRLAVSSLNTIDKNEMIEVTMITARTLATAGARPSSSSQGAK